MGSQVNSHVWKSLWGFSGPQVQKKTSSRNLWAHTRIHMWTRHWRMARCQLRQRKHGDRLCPKGKSGTRAHKSHRWLTIHPVTMCWRIPWQSRGWGKKPKSEEKDLGEIPNLVSLKHPHFSKDHVSTLKSSSSSYIMNQRCLKRPWLISLLLLPTSNPGRRLGYNQHAHSPKKTNSPSNPEKQDINNFWTVIARKLRTPR